jgi:hypothetical protein
MLLKVDANSLFQENTSTQKALIPLCNNPCLPEIVTKTFGWEKVEVEITDKTGKKVVVQGNQVGRKIVFLPHFSYGPVLPAEIVRQVICAIKEQGYHCEWRLTEEATESCTKNKVTTLLRLAVTEQLQLDRFDSNLRRKIRKCASNGVTVSKGKADLLDDFYKVYSRRMHQLGSPVLAKQWFQNLLEDYRNGEAVIWCAYYQDKPMGAALVLEYQGFYEASWFATLKEYNRLYVSYGLTWAMISHAINSSGEVFSLGRSTSGSSVHQYKQQWGGEDVPLYWNHSHIPGASIRNFTFISRLWKFIPYKVATRIGPFFARKVY